MDFKDILWFYLILIEILMLKTLGILLAVS